MILVQPKRSTAAQRQGRRRRGLAGPASRRFIARHRRWYWAGVAILLASSVWSLRVRSAELDRARDAWGSIVTVWCATDTLTAGDEIASGVHRCDVPAALAPVSAISSPEGVAAQRVDADSIVTEADLTRGAGPLALAPPGWAAVTIIESIPSGAETGERVVLASEGVVLVEEAVVIGDDGDTRLIAVPVSLAATVAAAADAGISIIRTTPQ